MTTHKNFLGGLAAVLLPIALFAFGAYMGAFQFLSSPEPVKTALDKSGLYDAAITEMLNKTQGNLSDTSGITIPTDNPQIQNLIKQAVPTADVKKQSEGAIDNIFAWLHGDQDKLNFALTLDQAKTQLADNLAKYTDEHLASLPACTGRELPNVADPLNATCWPAGVDTSIASSKVRDSVLNNQAFSQDSTLTAENVQNSDGKTLEQQLSSVPAAYEQIKWGTYIAGVAAVLSTVLLLLFSGGLSAGLKRLGIIALIVGGVSAVVAWLAGAVLQRIAAGVANDSTSSALQGSVVKAVELVTQDVRNWWLMYGLGLIAAGAVSLVAMRLTKGRAAITPSQPAPTTLAVSEAAPSSQTAPLPANEQPAKTKTDINE